MSAYTIDQVAIQMYTLRESCKTLPDLVETLKKVKKIGYKAIQVSGMGVAYPEAKKAIDDSGLIICATHESSPDILSNPEAMCERLNLMGTKETAYPYPKDIDFTSEEAIRKFAKDLDAAGAVFTKNGMNLSYHNHALEFVRFGEATILDYIYQATNPAHLKAELDTYWVQYGGGDPTAWIEKVSGRAPLLHLKDYVFLLKENKATYCEVGSGTLDWKRILAAAKKAGTEWLIVEQDECPGDPFISIQKSFDYLKKLLGS